MWKKQNKLIFNRFNNFLNKIKILKTRPNNNTKLKNKK